MPRYELRRELGRGGMGVVWVAFDRELQREVAYKAMLANHLPPLALARFIREAHVTGQLEHPNIVPVHELGRTAEGKPYFTMKRVIGESLRSKLNALQAAVRQGRGESVFPLGERLEVLLKICDALGFAHAQGVIHRDLKPDNVMVGRHGEVLVMDWGLARYVADRETGARGAAGATGAGDAASESASTEPQTLDGSIAGTPAYMSPEQARGDVGDLDARSDIFCLGALLYEFLTLTPPYLGRTPLELLRQAAAGEVTPVHVRAAGPKAGGRVTAPPAELAAIAHKALATRPERRYASCAEFAADLRAFMAHQAVSAYRDRIGARISKWVRRNPTMALVVAVAIFGGLVVTALWAQVQSSERSAALETALRRQAEADARSDRQRADLADAERRRAEAEADAQNVRATLADARKAMLERQYDTVNSLLQGKALNQRDAAYHSMVDRFLKARNSGVHERQFMDSFTPAELAEALEAADYYIRAAEATGSPLVADDYALRGSLRAAATPRNLAGAIDDYTLALKSEPQNRTFWNERGTFKLDLNDGAGALEDFNRALRIDPDFELALSNRALAYVLLGEPARGLPDIERALSNRPSNPADLYAKRGLIRHKLSDLAAARADYDRALQMRPDDWETLTNRGLLRSAVGDDAGALADCDLAIKYRDDCVQAWMIRGVVHGRNNQPHEAVANLTRAIKLAPTMVSPYVYRAQAYLDLDQRSLALADAAAAVRLAPNDFKAHGILGVIYVQQSEWAKAIAEFSEAVRLNPDYVLGFSNRGLARVELGDYAGAISDFDTVLAREPRDVQSLYNRGRAKANQGDLRNALIDLRAARKLADVWEVWLTEGTVLAKLGERAEAERAFATALRLAPPDVRDEVESHRRAALGN